MLEGQDLAEVDGGARGDRAVVGRLLNTRWGNCVRSPTWLNEEERKSRE